MKFNPFIWRVMTQRMKPGLKRVWNGDVKTLINDAKPIYRELLSKVEGISDGNPMASNITMSFVIIAVWLASGRKIPPSEMSKVMEKMLDWKLLKKVFGMINLNSTGGVKAFGNMMKKNALWAEKHPEDWNTWDFHFDDALHQDGFYYHFTHCPIADFCGKYGCEEINPVLCKTDYTTMSMMHSVLHREHTVAEGEGVCDYWVVGDQINNPQ